MSDAKTIADTLTTVWEGSWGSISPSPHSVETLRLCKMENGREVELISYPYRSLEDGWRGGVENRDRLRQFHPQYETPESA